MSPTFKLRPLPENLKILDRLEYFLQLFVWMVT